MTRRALLLIAVAASACEITYDPDVGDLRGAAPDAGAGPSGSGTCGDSDPEVAVSFARDVRPLTTRVPGGCFPCHVTLNVAGFNLGSYAGLRRGGTSSGTRIVVAGKPCDSVIVQKLGLAPPFGARMPYNGPPYFSAAELTVVRDWIAEGAVDN